MKVILTCILRTEIIIDYDQPGTPVWEGRDNTLEADIEAAMCFGKSPIVHLKDLGYETDVRSFEVEVIENNVCRECGCTDDDCSGCIERTGEPCSWIEEDLCSACAPPQQSVPSWRSL